MINPWKYLTNKNNNEIEFQPLQPNIDITPLQVDLDGNVTENTNWQPERVVTIGNKVKNKIDRFGQNLYNNLMGQQATPTDNINTSNGAMNATISENPRTGGFLRDFSGGFHENRWTPASLDNFGQNTLADGRKKGFAYRAGEALGSLARFGESPLGRSLLVGGAIGALGGNPAEMLTYGATTGMLNQGNRMRDRAYRDDLIATRQNALRNSESFNALNEAEQAQILQNLQNDYNYMNLSEEEKKGLNNEQLSQALQDKQAKMLSDSQNSYLQDRQNQQLNDIANQVNSYRGYVDNNTYGNMMRAQQIRDDADWRRFYYDDQKAERQLTRELTQQEREYQHKQYAINNQLQRDKLAYDRADRAGVKFKDADLIGYPFRITVGKSISEGLVEFKRRDEKDVLKLTPDEAVKLITEKVDALK